MQEMLVLLKIYPFLVVFLFVFIEQVGLPIPAMPVLIIASALISRSSQGYLLILIAILAALSADLIWYMTGKKYGFRVLRRLCSISLSPDSCVRQTEGIFSRFGYIALIGSKFLPGFSTVAPPLAGATGIAFMPFVLFDGIGALIWTLFSVSVGRIFHTDIDSVLAKFLHAGSMAGFVVIVLFGFYLLFKWWERRKFYKALEMARISVEELLALKKTGKFPLVLDVRNPNSVQEGHIPGAILANLDGLDESVEGLPRDQDIVVYCNCPNEASAALVARALMDRGFARVRPLRGGLEAWVDAGLDVERGEVPLNPVLD